MNVSLIFTDFASRDLTASSSTSEDSKQNLNRYNRKYLNGIFRKLAPFLEPATVDSLTLAISTTCSAIELRLSVMLKVYAV